MRRRQPLEQRVADEIERRPATIAAAWLGVIVWPPGCASTSSSPTAATMMPATIRIWI